MLSEEEIELYIQDWSCTGWGDRIGEIIRISRAIESAAIDAFLARTGKYLTNDASREAAIADATAPLLERIAELEEKNRRLTDDLRVAWQEVKTEQRLSFRDQVAELERQNAIIRNEALEEAAKVCEIQEYNYWCSTVDQDFTPIDCAVAIRNLKQGVKE